MPSCNQGSGANADPVYPPFQHAHSAAPVEELLAAVQRRFYAARSSRDHAEGRASFHRDRRMLLYALTWPAAWLERRRLTCSAQRYHALIADRLAEIALHGDPARYGAYFPTYLLKCLQDWFQHHGEALYDELKHIRNALDQVLASARFAASVQRDAKDVELLVSAHRLIRAQREKRPKADPRQLSLF